MLSEREQQEHSDGVVRATLETEVLGRYDLVDAEKYTSRVTVPTTRQQQLLVRRGPGPAAGWRSCNHQVQRIGALRSVLARAPTDRGRDVICNIRRKICSLRWHFSRDPPAMWSCRKILRKSQSRWTDARLQVLQQICMQEAGQIERAASRTRARAWQDWATTTAMADGARLAPRWIKPVGRVGGHEWVGRPAARTGLSGSGGVARSLEGWSSVSERCWWCQQCSCCTISIS